MNFSNNKLSYSVRDEKEKNEERINKESYK